MRFKWRKGTRCKVPANVFGKEIKALKGRGRVTPLQVVQRASNKRSPIHKAFVWDDAAAGHEYRLYQARNYLNSLREIKVIIEKGEEKEIETYSYIRVMGEEDESLYAETKVVVKKEDYRQFAIKECLGYLKGFRKRYAFLLELHDIWDAIDRH